MNQGKRKEEEKQQRRGGEDNELAHHTQLFMDSLAIKNVRLLLSVLMVYWTGGILSLCCRRLSLKSKLKDLLDEAGAGLILMTLVCLYVKYYMANNKPGIMQYLYFLTYEVMQTQVKSIKNQVYTVYLIVEVYVGILSNVDGSAQSH